MLILLSTKPVYCEFMHRVWGSLASRVDPGAESDIRVREAVVASTVRSLRAGAAPLQALGLLATATALNSGSVSSIGDAALQVAA